MPVPGGDVVFFLGEEGWEAEVERVLDAGGVEVELLYGEVVFVWGGEGAGGAGVGVGGGAC